VRSNCSLYRFRLVTCVLDMEQCRFIPVFMHLSPLIRKQKSFRHARYFFPCSHGFSQNVRAVP